MLKPSVFLLFVTFVFASAIVAQDISEVQEPPEPNVIQQPLDPGQDAIETATEPNITRPSQEQRAQNNSDSTQAKIAEASTKKEPFDWTRTIALLGVMGTFMGFGLALLCVFAEET